MKELSLEKMESLNGGDSRSEYCGSLSSMFGGGGYQGNIYWFMDVFYSNCGAYGYSLW